MDIKSVERNRDFVFTTFKTHFYFWVDNSDIVKIYESMESDIMKDIADTASEEYTSNDVDMSIVRVLKQRLGIDE